ncbi:hypothetical protein SERLA73DRAFT_173563 [Serpula lacrymans var. lacrymans S7.3]|uniref:Protein kinase domain-containing protein n=2 Tax=Serpula lacrymans var. lacrymans TaxID=341189 RepID=F8PET5_SERL3|nr:uncharacterized protein SERLADRAFT_454343 [Serpula lacrymans var. lacrymans S7.9]EGO04146.1 hypothetical protein SERLA73DRAFT_173563 [Serpula lacrymans var. lacrymans S7.3]EGO30100.1 hypothetical protein SERLADRAFT_454343 [Serpula lacrymans var. lacrymans S7.9]
MLSRYPTGYAGPHYPLVLPYLASPLLDQYVAELPPPPTSKQDGEQSGEQSHDQQGGMQYAFKWFYQMVIPRVKPSSVVMYTGQRAGRSFALKELTNMETKKITYRDALLCLMELISDSNGCKVYRGKMDNKDVVAKVMSGGEAKERMKVEKDIYDRLLDMQGSSIPQCYGLFECLGSSYILVLSHCGDPLEAFSTLHKADKLQLMNILINIHKRGVIHNDVEPRNVVRGRQRNQLSLIDFGLSEVHKCGRFCDEIDNATMELEI